MCTYVRPRLHPPSLQTNSPTSIFAGGNHLHRPNKTPLRLGYARKKLNNVDMCDRLVWGCFVVNQIFQCIHVTVFNKEGDDL